MPSWFLQPVGSYSLVIGTAAVLIVLLLWISPQIRRMPARRRNALIALRLLVFVLIVLAMLRPTHVYTQSKPQNATLIVLVDRSRSMLVSDAFGDKSRWDALLATIDEGRNALRELDENLEVKVYTFDEDIEAIDFANGQFDLGKTPDGQQSALGAALEDALRPEAGKRIAAVLVLSDGAQQAYAPRDVAPQVVARRLRDVGAPLMTVPFGQERAAEQARDVAVTDLLVNSTVFVKNELPVTAAAHVFGLVNQDVPVQLLWETAPGKMEVVASTMLRATTDGQQLPINSQYVPQAPGEHKLTLRATPQPGELVSTNNELSTFVTVLDGGLNVRYLEGEPRVEQAYLRRSLNTSPDIQVDFEWFHHTDRKSWPVNLAEHFKPGKYDVYIIGDLDSKAFRKEDLEGLTKAVQQGAGLIMLGGFHTFWAGGYQDTPLKDVLPLEVGELDRFARQNFDEPVRKDLHLPGPIKMLPDERFGNISLMRMGTPERNKQAWSELPPLEGANLFRELKPVAKPLAVSPDGKPLLVAIEPGNGRVLAFGGDSTWHWWMQGFDSQHKRFWRQVILWLAKKDESSEGAVWVKLDQRRFAPASRVEFSAGARGPDGGPVTDAVFEANVVLPDGARRPVRLTRQGEETSGTFSEALAPGDYTIVVSAKQNDTPLGEAKARFIVHEQDLELGNPAARPALLASLSAITKDFGGESVPPEQFASLLERLKQRPQEMEVEVQAKLTPWDTPWFFLVVVGVLGVEWYLRKRWGLV